MNFPLFKSKMAGVTDKFDLTQPVERQKYFLAKAGTEIEKLKEYFRENTLVVYLMGKKNSGKGTYSKMLGEIIGPDMMDHFSIGDMIRRLDEVVADPAKKAELEKNLEQTYRGYLPLKEIMASLESRSTNKLLPTELILALVKLEIGKRPKKTLFIDGFPRDLDQVSYALFFRDLINYREDDDVFVLIDVPKTVIDERIKYRKICPNCQTSRNTKLLVTDRVRYDEKNGYYMLCDNPECHDVVMVSKEGDELGIEPIRERLEKDEILIGRAAELHGVKKVFLRNCIPVAQANELVDDYELTPEYVFSLDENKQVKVTEKPWQVKNDEGVESYSLLPPPVVLSLIKQLVEVLGL
jgi:adenylate kinase family enzyme